MRWVVPLSAAVDEPVDVIGGKGHGLVVLLRLGLPVPPGFVVSAEACRVFSREGRFPDGLDVELADAAASLGSAVRRPLSVSVRSGSSVSMPGMMDTVLDVPVPEGSTRQLELAVGAVFASWDTPRAWTYRDLHGVPHDLGTAVTVQAMVYGDRDERSGAGVAFSRHPDTGERAPFGDVLFGRQGADVVSGRMPTRELAELAEREPGVWSRLVDALSRVERHYRDVCCVEFTVESGELWLLQVRPGGLVGRAAVRVAVDLADEGVIDRDEALLRVAPAQLGTARAPRVRTDDAVHVLCRGVGASPGVAVGRVATTSDEAVLLAADGPVVLVRPETSPHDMRGIAAASAVVTARGGPTSHAAVVARAMGKPGVVGAVDLTVDDAGGPVTAGGRTVEAGAVVTVDGTGGELVLGAARTLPASTDPHVTRLLGWADDVSRDRSDRSEEERLGAARAVLRGTTTSRARGPEPGRSG